jgi:hypothetical protein
MLQPEPDNTLRMIRITCFICHKKSELKLRPWEESRKVECPKCHQKEVVISSL